MNKKLVVTLLMAALLSLLAGCGRNEEIVPAASISEDGVRDHVEFTWYRNYDWGTPPTWGDDVISAYWSEKFNISVNMDAPDAIPREVMNLMITAGDLPDAIWMERDPLNVEMTRLGLFYSIDELIAFGYDNWFHDNVPASTQNFHAVDGVNYTIPNWVRMGEPGVLGGATGGNQAWMKTAGVYEAVGSPTLATFEDMYEYAVLIRDANLTNHADAPIIPVLFNGGPNYGQEFVMGIFLSMGGVSDGWGSWYGINQDGMYGTLWSNSVWRAAVLEANRWHREGLFPATNLTNSQDQFEENLIGGRGGLIYHDHSVDNSVAFRRLLGEADPGNSVELIYHTIGNDNFIFLPARGLSHESINHQVHGTLGWNGTFITKGASNPGRIFELLTWMLSPLGSVEMMFGPQGHLWDSLTAEGYPILHTSPDTLTGEQRSDLGLWRWDMKGHANNVDNAKFAANAMLPPEERNWVDYMQATIFTPRLRLSDEFQLFAQTIDSTSDLGIRRQMIEDRFQEMLPQILLASTEADAIRMFDETRDFAFENGMAEIVELYNERWEYNKSLQGGSIFDLDNIPR